MQITVINVDQYTQFLFRTSAMLHIMLVIIDIICYQYNDDDDDINFTIDSVYK